MELEKTGALMAQARKERAMTQREVAQALHVTVQAVSKWERGLSFPDPACLERLSEVLGLTVSELVSGRREEGGKEELLRRWCLCSVWQAAFCGCATTPICCPRGRRTSPPYRMPGLENWRQVHRAGQDWTFSTSCWPTIAAAASSSWSCGMKRAA